MTIDIRQARAADLPQIVALHTQLLQGNEESLSLDKARHLFSRIQSYPNYCIYVAVSADEIVATFALLIMDNLAHEGAPSGIVEDVAVHQDWQGKGIGKQMMKKAMQYCKQAGCYKLVLSSNAKREAAHAFYESLGFRKHGYSFVVALDV